MSESEQIEALRRRLAAEPVPEPPAELVERWQAALAALPPPRTHPVRPARRHWFVAAAGIAAAAVLVGVPGSGPAAHGPAGSPPPSALDTRDARDIGELADPARMAGCLARVGASGATVLDSRRVEQRGLVGVRLVLPRDVPGHYRVLFVTEDCGRDTGRLLSDSDR